jgi:vanillate O-demethylase ferredoxin subunit
MAFTFQSSARGQLEQMVLDDRFKLLTQLPLFAPMEIGLGLFAYLLFFASTGLYLGGSLHVAGMLLINGFAIYLSFTPLHDATHRAVSRHRGINDAVGTICCLLLLPGITTRVYRYLHLEHHRYAGNLSKDPDEPFVSAPNWALPFVLAGLDVLWVTWYVKHWYARP